MALAASLTPASLSTCIYPLACRAYCSCTIWVDGQPSCVQADGKAIDCSDADAKDLVATVRGNEDGVWEGMAVLTAVTRPSIALMLMPRTLSPRYSAGGDQGMERVRGVLIW